MLPGSENVVTLNNLQTSFAIFAFFLLWGGTLWRSIKASGSKESRHAEALEKLTTDINEVGTRVNKMNDACVINGTKISALELELQTSRDDRAHMREKIGANEGSIKALQEELQADRLAVMSTLHANEKAAAERNAHTREELARISERLNVEQMVHSVVRSFSK